MERLNKIRQKATQYKDMSLGAARLILKNDDGALDVKELLGGVDSCLDSRGGFSAEDVLILVALHLMGRGKRVAIADYGNGGAFAPGGVFDGYLTVLRAKPKPAPPTEHTATPTA